MQKHRALITIIAAVADNGVIGNSQTNNLPWERLEGDLPRFKQITVGNGNNAVIMGRKTFLSFPKRPLPDRVNLVLTRDETFEVPEGVKKFSDITDAIDEYSHRCDYIFLIGGASVYNEGLQFADEMILTLVHQNPEGDVFFPDYDRREWEVVNTAHFPEYGYDVVYLKHKTSV